jgi:hypothetical protein
MELLKIFPKYYQQLTINLLKFKTVQIISLYFSFKIISVGRQDKLYHLEKEERELDSGKRHLFFKKMVRVLSLIR